MRASTRAVLERGRDEPRVVERARTSSTSVRRNLVRASETGVSLPTDHRITDARLWSRAISSPSCARAVASVPTLDQAIVQ